MHRRRHATTTTRRPTLFNRLVHPTTTPRRRGATTGTAAGPVGTHRTKPTLGARIHGMAKRMLGGVTGNRRKEQEGKSNILTFNEKCRINSDLCRGCNANGSRPRDSHEKTKEKKNVLIFVQIWEYRMGFLSSPASHGACRYGGFGCCNGIPCIVFWMCSFQHICTLLLC